LAKDHRKQLNPKDKNKTILKKKTKKEHWGLKRWRIKKNI
jgi:hypothetical protein